MHSTLYYQLITFLIAMLPISELRGAIPVALVVYHLPWWSAYFWAVLGNVLAVFFVLKFLDLFTQFLTNRSNFCQILFSWLFKRTRRQYSSRFERLGILALVTFVAIPLPMTGGWTGAIAAYIFGVPFYKAFFLISIGIIIAGLFVTLATLGILSFV